MNMTLSEQDVAKVQEIIMKQLEISHDQLTPSARIVEDLGADSLDVAEIVMQLEEAFHISIPDETSEQASTVEEICQLVQELLEDRK